MSIRPLVALIGALLATLAFASTASATPSTPIMHPIPKYACGNVTASWMLSTPDRGGIILGPTASTSPTSRPARRPTSSTTGLSIALPGLRANHKYVVRVRAVQYLNNAVQYSLPSGRAFQKTCLFIDPSKWAKEYVEYNPWDCWVCGPLDGLNIKDPVILNARPPAAGERQRPAVDAGAQRLDWRRSAA